MMSGPEPTLAATAAFGRMSSQLSLSTRTSTPVASVNFFVLASHWSSSPLTNGDQRSRRKVAPGSGLKAGAGAWANAGRARNAGIEAAPAKAAPPMRTSRRELFILFPPTVLVPGAGVSPVTAGGGRFRRRTGGWRQDRARYG